MSRTRILRRTALVVGLLYLLAALVVQATGASQSLLIYLAAAGLLMLATVYTWRRPRGDATDLPRGYWQMTGQRFRDPATGRTMEVRHNPVTGARDYVEVEGE